MLAHDIAETRLLKKNQVDTMISYALTHQSVIESRHFFDIEWR